MEVRAGPGEQQAGLRRGRDADLGGVRPGGGRRRASPIRVVRGAGDVWQAEEAVEGTVAWRVAPAACRAVSQPTPLTSFHIAECVTSCAVKVKVPSQRCKLREHGRGPGRQARDRTPEPPIPDQGGFVVVADMSIEGSLCCRGTPGYARGCVGSAVRPVFGWQELGRPSYTSSLYDTMSHLAAISVRTQARSAVRLSAMGRCFGMSDQAARGR